MAGRVTIKDIAKEAGVSRGTVDRVLNNRDGVAEDTKKKVLIKAKELNYKPNRIAQSLALQNNYNFYFILPYYPTNFYAQVRAGIKAAHKDLEDFGLNITILPTAEDKSYKEKELLEKALEKEVDGIAVLPINTEQMKRPINRVVEKGIPVLTFVSDIAESKRFCFIGLNNYKGGRMAGELMGKFLNGQGKVIINTNYTYNSCNRKRCKGFFKVLARYFPQIEIVSVVENHDSEKRAYNLTRDVLNRFPDINGIFTTNCVAASVGRALIDSNYEKKVRLIGFDITEEINLMLKEGIIYATICQEPFQQGYQAVKHLYEFVAQKKKPAEKKILTLPKVVFRETLINIS